MFRVGVFTPGSRAATEVETATSAAPRTSTTTRLMRGSCPLWRLRDNPRVDFGRELVNLGREARVLLEELLLALGQHLRVGRGGLGVSLVAGSLPRLCEQDERRRIRRPR